VFNSLTISSYADLNGDFQRKGIEKLELGNYNGAIIDFSEAIEIDPNDAVTYDYRGVAKAKRGDFSGAIVDYNKSIE
jgi:Flp pilus assembly protein TadD